MRTAGIAGAVLGGVKIRSAVHAIDYWVGATFGALEHSVTHEGPDGHRPFSFDFNGPFWLAKEFVFDQALCVVGDWISPGVPVDSIRLAVLTESPQRS